MIETRRKLSRLSLRAAWIVWLPVASWCGDITGIVTYAPPVKATPVMLSAYARNSYRPPVRETQGSSNETIIVYLLEHAALPAVAAESVPVMDQREISIQPHVMSVVVGSTVEFLNSDSVYHNLFSLSRAKQFNLGRYPRGQSRRVRFDRAGEVEIFCDIHSEMNGVVLVLPNPYLDTIDREGRYRIRDVPPGTYQVRVWREKSRGAEATVTVRAGSEEVILNFNL